MRSVARCVISMAHRAGPVGRWTVTVTLAVVLAVAVLPLAGASGRGGLVAGVFGGVLVGALVPWRRRRTALVGGVSGLAAVAVLLGATWQQFSADALRNPKYEGAIEHAPQVINAFERGVDSYRGV